MIGKEITCGLAVLASAALAIAQDAEKDAAPDKRFVGTVVDETGKPIASAAVGLVQWNTPLDVKALLKSPEFRTDANGIFSITRGSDDPRAQIVVAAKGRQACATFLPAGSTAATDLGQFVLPPGASLAGRIRDSEGEPVADVEIQVVSAVTSRWTAGGVNRRVMSGAISNERGIFQVPCVPRTGLQLTIKKSGYEHQIRLASHESPLAITLERGQVTTGKLVDSGGKPIAGVYLQIRHEANGRFGFQSVATAEDGSYTVGVPDPAYRYRLSAFVPSTKQRFESGLLRGSQVDPKLEEARRAPGRSHMVVRAVDKKTKKAISSFAMATAYQEPGRMQSVIFQAESGWQDYEGQAEIAVPTDEVRSIVVRTPGYATAATAIPEDLDEPIVVELGPEAVLKGRVVDNNGDPVVGVRVRALPAGQRSGSGPVAKHWPKTDKDGRYRIGCLQAGEHQVQVYPDNRRASPPLEVEVTPEQETTLDLTIPAEQKLVLEVAGNVPPGPAPIIAQGNFQFGGGRGFRHHVPPTPPVTLVRGRKSYDFGVVQGSSVSLTVMLPSRTRAGAFTTIPFHGVDIENGKVKLQLPPLKRTIMRGRIEVDTQLPTERIAVMAVPVDAEQQRIPMQSRRVLAGVFPDGSFMIDVPHGEYVLQLVDIETGMVFHTEAEDHKASTRQLVIRPQLHLLAVRLACEEEDSPIVTHGFHVTLDRPRGGTHCAFVDSYGRRGVDNQGINLRSMPMQPRWLVPAGTIEISVSQTPDMLRPGGRSFSFGVAARGSVDISRFEESIELRVPPPPSDEELRKPADK